MAELNPQQQMFKEAYLNPDSPTFSNATKSAISAGYGKEYAEQILSTGGAWISEVIGDLERQQKADARLDEVLSLPLDKDMVGHVVQVAKFVNKKKYDVSKQEVEHSGGMSFVIERGSDNL
jgi:phage terminase small subunit